MTATGPEAPYDDLADGLPEDDRGEDDLPGGDLPDDVPESFDVTNTATVERTDQLIQTQRIGILNINYAAAGPKVKAAALLTTERIRACLTGYVPPTAREVAAQRLREHHAVLLYGPPGTGRTTTALDILPTVTGLSEIHRVIFDFDPDAEDELERLPCDPNTGYLLDISDSGNAPSARIADLVSAYAARVRGHGSHLVVVARPDPARSERTDVPAVGIEPPDPVDVFTEHLSAAGLAPGLITRLRDDPRVTGLPMPSRPVDVAELTRHLKGVADDEHFDTAVAEAIGAYTDWRESLLDWFNKHGDLETRAFMCAAAVLHPGRGGTVAAAARSLTARLYPANSEPAPLPLQGPPLATRATDITARLDPDGTVIFDRPQYAPAVRHFIWQNYAEFRPELTAWLTSIPGGDAARAVEAVTDLVTATSDEWLLIKAAETWSAGNRQAAVDLLAGLAIEPGIGQRARALLYRWAYDGKDERRMLTVAAVCARYGTVYEQNALTRLRQLARHPRQQVLMETISAVCALAYGDAGRRRRIVEEVTGRWIPDSHRDRSRTGRFVFAALARLQSPDRVPVLLGDLARAPDTLNRAPALNRLTRPLAQGLRALLHADRRDAEAVINAWVDAAMADTTLYEPILDVLVRAAAGDSLATSRLAFIAGRWTGGPEQLHAFQRTLISTIERLDPLTHDDSTTGQEGHHGE